MQGHHPTAVSPALNANSIASRRPSSEQLFTLNVHYSQLGSCENTGATSTQAMHYGHQQLLAIKLTKWTQNNKIRQKSIEPL